MVVIQTIAQQENRVFDGTVDTVIRKCADGGLMFVINSEPELSSDMEIQTQIILEREDLIESRNFRRWESYDQAS